MTPTAAARRRPRRWTALFALVLALVVPSWARAQEARIAYINSERLFQDFVGFRDAERAYEQELDGWLAELKNREQRLVELESDFRAQAPMLSEERRREMESNLQRGTQEYEQFRQSIFGQGGKAQLRNQQLLEPVLAQVQVAVEAVAEAEAYDLVFDAVDGNIIYGEQRYDITDLVLDRLGADTGAAGTPGESTAPPGGGDNEGEGN